LRLCPRGSLGAAAGCGGVENEQFRDSRTPVLFGDAKKSLESLVAEVKAL
jgi:NAD/NADP transhydrogenase beta subunit